VENAWFRGFFGSLLRISPIFEKRTNLRALPLDAEMSALLLAVDEGESFGLLVFLIAGGGRVRITGLVKTTTSTLKFGVYWNYPDKKWNKP